MRFTRLSTAPRRAQNLLKHLVRQHMAEFEPKTLAHVRAWFYAASTVWRSRADILSLLRNQDEALAFQLRRRFGLDTSFGTAQLLPGDLFQTAPTHPDHGDASLIIPIHNAADCVSALLQNLERTLPENQNVILVNDRSTDPRIARLAERFLKNWSAAKIITLERNQGFVAAINVGLGHLPPGHHAILLNSDTLPPDGWVPRLLAPFAKAKDIASVTPLSNAAEILSVPTARIATKLSADMVQAMDNVAHRLKPRLTELPTGIGFCMALNRQYLDLIGAFDDAFGKGYGEEVDWCQRALAVGGRHVAATNLVVGHVGSASFGSAQRQRRVATAKQRVTERYPEFNTRVEEWITHDPIAPERLAIALGWVADQSSHEVPVYIAHALGGGAETALQSEITEAHRNGTDAVVVLRVGGPAAWRVELCHPHFFLVGDVAQAEMLHTLLAPLARRHIIYSCAVHAENPGAVPHTILRLAKGHRLTMRLHDFFPISPSWNLLDGDGRFSGIPALDNADPAHAVPQVGGQAGLSHREWRARWGRVMDAAQDITVFSASSGELVRAAYPEANSKIVFRPHEVTYRPPVLRPGGQSLGVLGGINHAKGGSVLQRLSQGVTRRIAIIGELDGCFHLPEPHVVHGRFLRSEIAHLARAYDVGAWFLPSVCPETFSFATHEALATGLPVACFNLGAQAETLRIAPNGHVLDLDPDHTGAIATRLERLFET